MALASGLALSPLAFGGTAGWFTAFLAVAAGGLALAWSAIAFAAPDLPRSRLGPVLVPACLTGAAILWCFVQAFLPVAESIAPAQWGDAARLLGRTLPPMLSLNPEASISGAMRLAAYGIVFLLCYQFAADEACARRLLVLVTVAGTAYAAYGIWLELSGSGLVLWFDRTFEPGNLSSTFPNRNAFASYATLCLLGGFTLLHRRRVRQGDLSSGWRRATVSVVRYYFHRNGWLFYAVTVLFVAILWTHSRAGLATAIVAFLAFAACAAGGARYRRIAAGGSLVVVAVAVAIFAVAGGGTVERFGKIEAATAERIEIYRLTIGAIADRPLLGTGLGTFSDVFPAYRSAALRPQIDFAHNSYLENALEMGIPAALLFYGGLAALFVVFLRALFRHRGAHSYPALGIAALAAAGFHALFDYAVQFPAVAITLAALLGVAAAQSVQPRQPDGAEAAPADRRDA